MKLGQVMCARGHLYQFHRGVVKQRRHTVSVDNLDEIENMSTDTETDSEEDRESADEDAAADENKQLSDGKCVLRGCQTNDKVGRLLWAWFTCLTKSANKIGEP